jgi:hypothetical protein
MVPIEVVIIGALVVFMLAVAILPALVRSMQGGGGEKREKKTKRGVTKSQMCLQPGCMRCAFSTDPASLQAFRRHLWESFRALATTPGGDHLGPAQDAGEQLQPRPTIHSRIGPAVKRLVTTSTPPGVGDAPLLPIEGLSAIDDARRLAWVDQLLPAIPRMAAEARRAWSERVAPAPTADKAGVTAAAATTTATGEGGGRWRRQEDAAGDGCVAWKWDLWNQGTLVEAHAQRAPETVQLLEQHAADSLMVWPAPDRPLRRAWLRPSA